MDTGKKIGLCRKEAGLSQEALADKLGISRQAVSRWETGEALPDTVKIVQLARIFNVSCDYLLLEEVEDRGCAVNDEGLASSLDRAFIRLKKTFHKLKPVLSQMRPALMLGFAAVVLGWLSVKVGYGFIHYNTQLQSMFVVGGTVLRIGGALVLIPACGVVLWELVKVLRQKED